MEVKNLILYEDLLFSTQESSRTTPFERLTIYTNGVAPSNLEPELSLYLTEKTPAGFGYYSEDLSQVTHRIPAGTYFFLQEFIDCSIDDEDALYQKALKMAEALRLESLWQEVDLDDQVFVRAIKEDEKLAVQVIRRKRTED